MAGENQMKTQIDAKALQTLVNEKWDQEIIPALMEDIRVPAKSPAFDAQWADNGFIDKVVHDAVDWVKAQQIQGLQIEVIRLKHENGAVRTPVIYFEIPAFQSDTTQTVLMYGHLDKQPEFSGWSKGLGPWEPQIVDNKLYGRGGADDGYAIYAGAAIAKVLQQLGASHPRIVGLIETCEESGSTDLPAYLDVLRLRMGDVGMVLCLDSGAGNYDQLWMTNSLRGMASGVLRVDVLTQGIHSGDASGVVPSSMRIMRTLLDRLEDSRTGQMLPQVFQCEIPAKRMEEAQAAAHILGAEMLERYPWAAGADGTPVQPVTTDLVQVLLNRTWGTTLSVTGVDGMPTLADAGNVLRPYTALKLSLRLPPAVNGEKATQAVKTLLEKDAPYNAKVTFVPEVPANGWSLPDYTPWLDEALQTASQTFYGVPCAFIGQGGTIPLINMLQENFPKAQMLICGVLGPNSNAHGPDEFLHLPYAKKLTAAVAQVLAAHP